VSNYGVFARGHNGFKWKLDGDLIEIEARIKELNNVIYQRGQTKFKICLAFAKRIVVERKDIKMNWARFAKQINKD